MKGKARNVLGGRERRRMSGEAPLGETEEGAGSQGRPHRNRPGSC